ncbi:uncharacterized protein UV8b_05590 [Ustilaginoidea virens]|uniref:UDP-N-acetylglucosamine transferase subunit ALG14 n=1 Tax=Ustilaginoidea virens TaxID=1159556 RepID=A0A8E5MIT0_USTVR|nr:uncharacterized protein UV8b_05590 [Ustilaginoidea virens]QUC21347.1 hypothetical protein UV8b_05590 [Ustilaginoidea virens]
MSSITPIVTIGAAIAMLLCAATIAAAHFTNSRANAFLTLLTGLVSVSICITTRHIQVARARRARTWPIPPFAPPKDAAPSQGEYFLFVLGSGGHTKEMLMMMDDGTPHQGSCHRRYLISSGDSMSESHLDEYEAAMRRGASAPGTYDKRVVTRARRVHQPLWSTPWTSLLSIVDIFPALLSPPRNGAAKEGPKYPGLIFSNGPATGLPVALAVHLLKVVGVVPHEAMKFVYIESWARISTLSLTGKLLYYTGIADAFYVQHEEVAVKYGVMNAGQMVFNAQRPPPVTSS